MVCFSPKMQTGVFFFFVFTGPALRADCERNEVVFASSCFTVHMVLSREVAAGHSRWSSTDGITAKGSRP